MRLAAELFWVASLVALPILGVTLLVGLLVSVLQVITQIQEMSLTFVPKLIAAAGLLILAGPWMLEKLGSYMTRLWSSIPSMI